MRWVTVLLFTAGVLFPGTSAATVRLGLGADLVFGAPSGLFELTLAVDHRFARNLSVGGRFGALITSGGDVGAPIDLHLRAILSNRVYIEGLVGPWLFFGGGDVLVLHAAFGFGLITRSLEIGLEVGWLGGAGTMLGLRLAWRI